MLHNVARKYELHAKSMASETDPDANWYFLSMEL